MGTWGPGNLDSDYALDELSSRAHELVTELLLRAQRSTSREYDEYDYTTLFVEFELVFALEAANLLDAGSRTFPPPDTVRALAQSFIADWDKYIGGEYPERRKVILDTFERFAQICATHEGEALLPQPPKPVAKQATPRATAKSKPKANAKAKAKAKAAPKAKSKAKAKRR